MREEEPSAMEILGGMLVLVACLVAGTVFGVGLLHIARLVNSLFQ